MRKIALFIIPLLLMAAGCTKENTSVSKIVFESDTVNVSGLGGNAEIKYSIENPVEGTAVKPLSGEGWITGFDVATEGTIAFEVAQNTTEKQREAIVEVSYGSAKAYFTVIQGDEMAVTGDFGISILSLNDYEIHCSITPENGKENMPYIYGIIDRETYNRFSSDEYFWDYIIESRPDFVSETVTGNVQEASFAHLEPLSGYVVYCAGTDDSGNNTTELSLLKFTTKEPVTFGLSQEVDGAFATLHATPSYDDRWYYFDAFSVGECGGRESAYDYIVDLVQYACSYNSWGSTEMAEKYMRAIMTTGESSKRIELAESTDYFAIAICFDFQCNPTSEMTITEFSTEEVQPSDMLITIDITDITTLGAHYKVTPTNDDQFLFFVEAVDTINEMWSEDDDELMSMIASFFPTTSYGRAGIQEGNVNNLEPGTRYMAFAFGCEAYKPTTRLFKAYFTTEEAIVGDVDFELIFDEYYDGSELEDMWPNDFAGASGYAVLPVRAYTKNGSGFYYGIYDGDYTDLEEWPEETIIDALIANGITEATGNYLVAYNTTRTALGVAYDAKKNFGKVFRKLVYCTEDGVTPAEDFKPASAMLSEASAAAGAATEDGYGIQAGRIFSNPTAIKH